MRHAWKVISLEFRSAHYRCACGATKLTLSPTDRQPYSRYRTPDGVTHERSPECTRGVKTIGEPDAG